MPFINTGVYGDGDLYHSDSEQSAGYVANQETKQHHISVLLKYTASLVPGASEAFRLLRMALRVSPYSVSSDSYEAFIDRVEATGHISAKIQHTGSEFILSHVQLTVQPKKHQPKG